MTTGWDQKLRREGERLREDYPAGLRESMLVSCRRRRIGVLRPLAVATAVIVCVLLAPNLLKEAGKEAVPAGGIPGALRAELVVPREESPIRVEDEPICAALYPPFPDGSIRVYLDERDMTSFSERHQSFIILDIPEPVTRGPHLLRLELTDGEGTVVGEPSWVIFTL